MKTFTNALSLIIAAASLSACGMAVPECYDEPAKSLLAEAIFKSAEQGAAELLHTQGVRRMLSAAGENAITNSNRLEITKAEQISQDEKTKVRSCRANVTFVPSAENQIVMKEISDGSQVANDNLVVGFTHISILPDLRNMYAEKITEEQAVAAVKAATAHIVNNAMLAAFGRGQKAPIMNHNSFMTLLSAIDESPHFTDEEKYLLEVDEANAVLNNAQNPRSYWLLKEDIAKITDMVRKSHTKSEIYSYVVEVKTLDGKEHAVVETTDPSKALLRSLVLTTVLGKAYAVGKEKLEPMHNYHLQKQARQAAIEAKTKIEAATASKRPISEEEKQHQVISEANANKN